MPGHHSWGHIGGGLGHGLGRGLGGGWGRGFGHGFGGGWGLGWIFPAMIVGQAISRAFDQPAEAAPPSNWPPHPTLPFPAPTPPKTAVAAVTPASVTCQGCGRQVGGNFTFCPECGERVTPAVCRYCGQMLQSGKGLCAHCGAPRR